MRLKIKDAVLIPVSQGSEVTIVTVYFLYFTLRIICQ